MSSLAQGGIIGLIAMVLFMTGMPIAFALAITALASIVFFLGPDQFSLFGKMTFDSLNDFGLLAIPLFVLMGNTFGGSQASRQLFEAGEAWLSRIRGGLAMSSVAASTLFAALTGSSAATAASIGRVAVPEMEKRGYASRISTGAIAAGGTLGILIPPSVTLILYGIAAKQSIGQLFAGGIVPGIIVALMFCVWIFIAQTMEDRAAARAATSTDGTAVEAPRRRTSRRYSWMERFTSLTKVLPFAALIAVVLIVLYRGIATPSEAAAIGVLLVWVLVALIYRGLSGRQLMEVLKEILIGSVPYVGVLALAIVLFSVFPEIVLFVPNWLY